MRIVTWNCNGAFRKKHNLLDRYACDLAIIQETEDIGTLGQVGPMGDGAWCWHGGGTGKGLAVVARPTIQVQPLNWMTGGAELFLPVQVDGRFNLVAVWTKRSRTAIGSYVGQAAEYVRHNAAEIAKAPTLLVGDFNSNAIWDKRHKRDNHSSLAKQLGEMGLTSLYHAAQSENPGKEQTPTLYFHKNRQQVFHIDYVFLPQLVLPSARIVEIGSPDDWLRYSDHMPIVFEFNSDLF